VSLPPAMRLQLPERMQNNAAMEANFGPQTRNLWTHRPQDHRRNRHFSSNCRSGVSTKLSAFSNAVVRAAALPLPSGEVGI
jgi:hypothetical protein